MRVLVTGATGLIGSRLIPILLKAGHAVVATSRDPESIPKIPGVLPFGWDGKEMLQVPGKIDGIIHLAGEPIIGKRWTAARKERIRDSRVLAAQRISDFIARRRVQERPKVFVSANAVGYYGVRPEGVITENSPNGTDFLAQLCKEWEDAVRHADTRIVVLRIGHVLSRQGGYLGALLPLARFGLAGPLGSGRQPMPWVHLDDVCGVILWALTHDHVEGMYNVTGPQPATQRQFVKALNKVMPIPSLIPVPGFVLRLRFGEVAKPILGGQNAVPSRLQADGYEFGHSELSDAVRDAVQPKKIRKGPKIEALKQAASDDE